MQATQDPARVSHQQVHHWLRKAHGPASGYLCIGCGGQAAEWSYDHTDPDPRYDVRDGMQFSLDIARYQPLCRTCHRRFDRRPVAERYPHPRERATPLPARPIDEVRRAAQARLDGMLAALDVMTKESGSA